MEIRYTEENGIALVHLAGRFDELATRAAGQAFQKYLDTGAQRVLLDLSGVDYVSSSALRVLLMLHREIAKRSGSLKLSGLTPFVAEVMETSNLNRVFEVFPSRESALRSYSGAV